MPDNQTLQSFLKKQRAMQGVNNKNSYVFSYKGVKCHGQAVHLLECKELLITPIDLREDIGRGIGLSVLKVFKK